MHIKSNYIPYLITITLIILITPSPIITRNGGAIAGGLLGGFALGTMVSNASQRQEPQTTYIYNGQQPPSYSTYNSYNQENRINDLENELYETQQENKQLHRYLAQHQRGLTQLRQHYDHLETQSKKLKTMYEELKEKQATIKLPQP